MYKISDEVINFIEKIMKTRRVYLTAEAKIQKGIFQGNALSPLLFIIMMMSLNYILRKCTAGYEVSKSQEKINHLMFMDDIKMFAKKWKRIENSNTCNEDIYSRHRHGIWHRKMRHARNIKRQTTPYGRNGNTKSRQNLNGRRKGNLEILGDIGSLHHQIRDERKN